MTRRSTRITGIGVAAVLTAALAAPSGAAAQGFGNLNPGFNGSGLSATSAQLFAVAANSAGDVYAAGQSGGKVYVEELSPGGTQLASYTGGSGVARAVAVQSNGEVVIAGNGGSGIFAERLSGALAPDSSFGSGGLATALTGQSGTANAITIAPGGDIVVGGAENPPDTQAVAVEFTPSGALNGAFGSGGIQTVSTGFTAFGGGYAQINGLAAEPSGQIAYVGSQTTTQGITNGVVGIFNANGSNDGSFSAAPYHYTPAGGSSGYTDFQSVAIAPGDEIIVSGVDYGGQNALILRYTPSGSLDSSFANGGVAVIPAASNHNPDSAVGAYGVALAGGDTVVGTGQFETSATNYSGAVWGLSSNGSFDSGFGSGGTTIAPVGSSSTPYEACGMTVAPDGTIYTVGYTPTATPDPYPCAANAGSAGGFVASFVGNGPPPVIGAGSAPAVSTGSVSALTSNSATVTGTVNPDGLDTTYAFQYGTSTAYSSETTIENAGAGTSATVLNATLTGLAPGTTYHYRIVATNADGTVDGADMSFTTPTGPSAPPPGGAKPTVSTGGTFKVGEASARSVGMVNPDGLATTYTIQYGKTIRNGLHTATFKLAAETSSVRTFPVLMSRLAPGTVYHYRLVATNADGTVYGAERSFKTAPRLKTSLRISHIDVLHNRRLIVGVTCSATCNVYGALKLSAPLSRALHLGRGVTTVASGRGHLNRRGLLHLFITAPIKDARALASRHGLTGVQLLVIIRPNISGPAVFARRNLLLRG
ncbi:hypothetical protein [Conexibacter sp. DBS9H8]|uniref:hypothetical protein n=1 Tax=Conexibacter sp. DBS9H8 TaxID=2937801 RepID=UPI0020100FF6|nr:hypothetical protein [Conexibacter sp. DBS9H8]